MSDIVGSPWVYAFSGTGHKTESLKSLDAGAP